MSTSGFIFIPNNDNPLLGTVVGVSFAADQLGDQLRELVARDGYQQVADTLRRHEWRGIDLDYPDDDTVGTVGAVAGYGEFYNEPGDELDIAADVPCEELGRFRVMEPYVYVLHPDGTVTSA